MQTVGSSHWQMTPSSIALNRFGLGYKPGDTVAGDPRGWLVDQVGAFGPPAEWDLARVPDGQSLASMGKAMAALKRERNDRLSRASDDKAQQVLRETAEAMRPFYAHYEHSAGLRTRWAVESNTPFIERLVHFWANHFAIDVRNRTLRAYAGSHEIRSIRPFVTGSFGDLLRNASLSPAMLIYLDQIRSIGPNSVAGRRNRATGRPDRAPVGLNENLAREILELHTLGVEGGYSQSDVSELARALTGWDLARSDESQGVAEAPPGTAFRSRRHEPGSRRIAGRTFPEGGPAQALDVLDHLSRHPSTAQHLATKLARHFAGDVPPEGLVRRLRDRFLETDGNLGEVYRVLIESDACWVDSFVKYRTPIEWMTGAFRAVGSVPLQPRRLTRVAAELGQPFWSPGSPAGFPDLAAAWLASDALSRRVRAAGVFARRSSLRDVRKTAQMMFPGSLSRPSQDVLNSAASEEMAFALLLVSPEMLRR